MFKKNKGCFCFKKKLKRKVYSEPSFGGKLVLKNPSLPSPGSYSLDLLEAM
jgi:hypothetical protein